MNHAVRRLVDQPPFLPISQLKLHASEPTRLMIVDDDARTREALLAYLATVEGFCVVGLAANGQAALNVIRTNMPDVVLMDVRMPVMGGIETIRQIKDLWPQVKIVALSMYADSMAEAEAAGADAFLLKGGSLEALVGTLRSVSSN